MTVHHLCHLLLVEASPNVPPHSAGEGEIYTECDSLGVTLACVYHAYLLSILLSVGWWTNLRVFLPCTLFAFLPGHSGNNIPYPQTVVIPASILAMFVAGFFEDDDGRGCLTTWRLYTLQIHYSLVHINSPIYWHIFLEHLLCNTQRDNAASLFLGSQLIYFILFLRLSKSLFLCIESRCVCVQLQTHKTPQSF